MALDDLSPDEGDNDSGGTRRRYVDITQDEFEEFLRDTRWDWDILDHPSGEIVYGTEELVPDDRLATVIFSTLAKGSGVSREKGADAIRLVLWHKGTDSPIGGRKKTLRIETWRKNLRKKLDSLADEYEEHVEFCDECDSLMVKREGRYGEFLGCIRYPNCTNTKQIDD